MSGLDEGDYDPMAPATLDDPFSAHARLRSKCPVHHYAGFGERGFYTLSRYEDVVDLFRNLERWSGEFGQGPIYYKEGGLRSDPPEHTIYRRLVTRAMPARRVPAMEDDLRRIANALVDNVAERGEGDLIRDFAMPLPVIVISRMLGVPPEMGDEFKAWSDEFMAGQNAADPEVQGRARAKIDGFFSGELERRRNLLSSVADDLNSVGSVLPDDILTAVMLHENEGRRFTDDELLPLLLLLLVGGNETTTSLIGSLVRRLLDLGLWEQVVRDRSTWDVAIEESLRYDPPVQGLFRTARGEQTLHGVTIPSDAKVQGLFSSANRDPDIWDDPDTFRLDRDLEHLRATHTSFGVGIWFCPGAALARREARVALEVLGSRLPNLRRNGPCDRVASFMMWGPQSLPVAWDV
ncbi:MAG: cytochrome P450 [Acidobacteriota bacterium]|nr:cytochrome P450 [Acidobacteriota bacterium]